MRCGNVFVFAQQIEDCKAQEEMIGELMRPMDHYREQLSSAFDKVRNKLWLLKLAFVRLHGQTAQACGMGCQFHPK